MSPPNDRPSLDYEDRPLLQPRYSLVQEHGGDATEVEYEGRASRAQIERSLLRKLDRRMSILVLIYILNYIDRNNAVAARLRGFEEDLHLEGNQFASIISVLYVGYIFMQIPSNMLLVYVGKPSIYLPVCMVIWGFISILTGTTTNFFGALCTRFSLGFVEAAFYPGALFLISKWYTKKELSHRTALLCCGILISNAFGSLIASGILDTMDGVLGFTAWRWLFFVEGSLTILVAILAVFVLPDFPESPCSWLTPAERALAIHRMTEVAEIDVVLPPIEDSVTFAEDVVVAARKLNESQRGLKLALADWKVWWLAFSLGVMNISLSFNFFFPTLSQTLGYGLRTTLLLCVPPWIFSALVSVAVSSHSDQTGERFLHIAIPLFIAALGFVISILTMNTVLRYMSMFLMVQAYSGYVCFLAWATGTISRPSSKRAVALALINCGSTVGNIIGSYVWPSSWGPSYSKSYAICILCAVMSVGMCFAFRQYLVFLNGTGHKYVL